MICQMAYALYRGRRYRLSWWFIVVMFRRMFPGRPFLYDPPNHALHQGWRASLNSASRCSERSRSRRRSSIKRSRSACIVDSARSVSSKRASRRPRSLSSSRNYLQQLAAALGASWGPLRGNTALVSETVNLGA
jgi:hypothetical protein